MRLVVLLCGVIAGIVGLGFAWWGEPGTLVDIYRLPTPQFAAAVLAIHAISVNSIAGGLMVLGNPRVGGMMMLASATVWLLIVAVLGSGLGVSMAALIGIGGGGGVLAFLPSLSRSAYRIAPAREDEPLEIGQRPRNRAAVVEDTEPRQVSERPRRRRPRGGFDWSSSVQELPPEPPPEREKPRAPEEPEAHNWRSTVEPMEDHSKPFEPSQWRFEAPDESEDEAADAKQDLPNMPPPRAARPPPRGPIRPEPWLGRRDRSEHREAYEIHHGKIRPLALKTPRKKRSRGRTIIGLVALGVVLVGLPALLVLDHQIRLGGDETAATAQGMDTVAAAREAKVQTQGPAASQVTEAKASPVQPRLEAGKLPEFDATAPPPDHPLAVLPLPAGTEVAIYPTPFDYCEAERDVDQPRPGLVVDGLPAELVDGVRQVTKIADAEVLWRCMAGRLWVCAQEQGGAACGKVPTPAERTAYCEAHPGATDIVAAAGNWKCNGKMPVVPGGDQRTTDARGYDRLAWLGLSKTPNASG